MSDSGRSDTRRSDKGRQDPRDDWVYVAAIGLLAAGAWAACIRTFQPVVRRSASDVAVVAIFVLAGFLLAVFNEVSVTSRGSRLSLTFTEIPFLVGVVFLSPAELLAVTASAFGIRLAVRRRWTPASLGNLANYLVAYAAGLASYHWVLGAHSNPVSFRGWLAGAACLAAEIVVSAALYLGFPTVIRSWGEAGQAIRTMAVPTARTLGPLILLSISAVAMVWANNWAAVLVAGIMIVGTLVFRARTALEDRYGNLDRLYQFVSRVALPDEFEDVLTAVLAEVKSLVAARTIFLAVPDGQDVIYFSLDDDGVLITERRTEMPVLADLARSAHRATLALSSTHDPQVVGALAELGARDAMAAPLTVGGHDLGALIAVERHSLSSFRPHDLDLFEALAANSAVSLRSSRLLARLRREAKAREHEALHDALTGLPNRTLFTRGLDNALLWRRSGELVSVMLMDLDGFKEVNDALGHDMGDTILQEVAARLTAAVHGVGSVARFGGDEFAFVLPAMEDLNEVIEVGTTLLNSLVRPMNAAGLMLGLRASLGVSVAEHSDETAAALLKRADVAMYQAKSSGGGIELYDPSIDRHTTRRLIVASELRRALAGDGIEVWYQPKANLHTGHVGGVEALLRWTHPQHGPIPPEEFIPAAEQSGLIGPLTWRVVGLAIDQLRIWHGQGLHIGMALNLSARTLLDANLVQRIRRTLDGAGLEPQWLTLELTESSIVADPARSTAVLRALADAGIRLALDDFGTGYSSLTRLKTLPIHEVKIDKSFVGQMSSDPGDAAIVRATIDLAQNLGHTTVAEGVEDAATWDKLTVMGCDEAQGYYLARPMPTPSFEAWLAHRGPGKLTLLKRPHQAPGA